MKFFTSDRKTSTLAETCGVNRYSPLASNVRISSALSDGFGSNTEIGNDPNGDSTPKNQEF